LDGIAPFACSDARRQRLLRAQFRLGKKPLPYCERDGRLLFGSEIKAVFAHGNLRREFNRAALPEFLAFGYLSGEESFYDGIRKLMPGHTMTVGPNGKPKIQQYWDIDASKPHESRDENYYVQAYPELLEGAVQSHLMSDVPLGVFLSGGVDSSAVAALMTKLRREPVETFSVGYTEQTYSELPGGSGLFDSMVVFENYPFDSAGVTRADLHLHEVQVRETTNFPLSVQVSLGEHLGLRLAYDPHLFDATTIQRMGRHLLVLLAGITTDPDQPIAQLPMLTTAEREQLLVEWNDTRHEVPAATVELLLRRPREGRRQEAEGDQQPRRPTREGDPRPGGGERDWFEALHHRWPLLWRSGRRAVPSSWTSRGCRRSCRG